MRMAAQHGAHRGQHHGPGDTVEQRGAERQLEIGDLLRNARAAGAEPSRGKGHRAGLLDGDKHLQGP